MLDAEQEVCVHIQVGDDANLADTGHVHEPKFTPVP